MTTYRPPGLSEREKQALQRLAKKERITDIERGQLAWYAFAGDRRDADRARSIIDRHKQEKE